MPHVVNEQAEAIESTAITFAIGALCLLDGLHCASVGGRCKYQVGLPVELWALDLLTAPKQIASRGQAFGLFSCHWLVLQAVQFPYSQTSESCGSAGPHHQVRHGFSQSVV
jgi:hypothetical protein